MTPALFCIEIKHKILHKNMKYYIKKYEILHKNMKYYIKT